MRVLKEAGVRGVLLYVYSFLESNLGKCCMWVVYVGGVCGWCTTYVVS